MKLICNDQDYCGFVLKITENIEYNLDLSKKIHLCPNCSDSLAILVEDTYVFQQKEKEKTINLYIQELNKIVKL
jgi:hypothetical protein